MATFWEGLCKLECDHPRSAPCHGALANESCHEARWIVRLGPDKDVNLGVCGVVPIDPCLAQVERVEANSGLTISHKVMSYVERAVSRLCGAGAGS